MSGDEAENGRDEMLIDEIKPMQGQINAIPEGFNVNYLKVYYGNFLKYSYRVFMNLG